MGLTIPSVAAGFDLLRAIRADVGVCRIALVLLKPCQVGSVPSQFSQFGRPVGRSRITTHHQRTEAPNPLFVEFLVGLARFALASCRGYPVLIEELA